MMCDWSTPLHGIQRVFTLGSMPPEMVPSSIKSSHHSEVRPVSKLALFVERHVLVTLNFSVCKVSAYFGFAATSALMRCKPRPKRCSRLCNRLTVPRTQMNQLRSMLVTLPTADIQPLFALSLSFSILRA